MMCVLYVYLLDVRYKLFYFTFRDFEMRGSENSFLSLRRRLFCIFRGRRLEDQQLHPGREN